MAKTHADQALPTTLNVLPSTPQIRGIHTFIRNRETSRDEFIFYSKRLIRLLIEFTLSLLPFKVRLFIVHLSFDFSQIFYINQDVTVETPQGINYQGKRILSRKICGVSILRAGETMEQALCDVLKDVRLGKILIQTNLETDEPELYYLRLPKDIKDYKVMLMDATVASGKPTS